MDFYVIIIINVVFLCCHILYKLPDHLITSFLYLHNIIIGNSRPDVVIFMAKYYYIGHTSLHTCRVLSTGKRGEGTSLPINTVIQ